MSNKKISEDLIWVKNATSNALTNPNMLNPLSKFSYNEEKLTQGKELVEQAEALVNSQEVEVSEKLEAYQTYLQEKTKLNTLYIQKIDLGGIIFSNSPSAISSLELLGSRNETVAEWFTQVGNFYTKVLDNQAFLDAYAIFGITLEDFTAEQASYNNVLQLYQNWKKERGESEDATEKRDDAVALVRKWMKEFKIVAKIAFADQPQLLEIIGIKA